MENEPILLVGTDKMILRYAYQKPFKVHLPNRHELQNRFNSLIRKALSGNTDGSKTNEENGAGVYKWGSKKGHRFSVGLHTTVFHAEIYIIKECILENVEKGYKGRYIYILSDSQAAIKALNNFQINSELVWDCHQSLVKLAEYNRIQLICMLGHMGNDVNEISDQLDTDSSSHLLLGLSLQLAYLQRLPQG